MLETTRIKLMKDFGIQENLLNLAEEADQAVAPQLRRIREISEHNQLKVLRAYQEEGLGEGHFAGTSGYGFHDTGREALDRAVGRIFNSEAALVRWQIVSGTHALSAVLFGNLRPGDEWVSVTGSPYDTLHPIISGSPGALSEWGISFKKLDLRPDGSVDFERLEDFPSPKTRLAYIQRSRGYEWRPSVSVAEIGRVIGILKRKNPNIIVMVDNCYGEMVEEHEPTEVGADVVGGSLIKNLGGGLCPTGGYIAGRTEVVTAAARHLTAPGIGEEEGPTLGISRTLFQGIFLSPLIVREALEGAIWASFVLEKFGLEVSPRFHEERTDIIQAIRLGTKKHLETFLRGIQSGGPVDSRAVPTAARLPGYRDPILMAGGTFVQGSSIELSADGPLREPYAAYLQGGLSSAHVRIAVLRALQALTDLRP